MAASRNMALMGLLMASCLAVCASARAAGSVTTPVETMKFVDLPGALRVNIDICLTISLEEWLPTEIVEVLVTGAGCESVVPFKFVGGIVRLTKTISVTVSVAAPAPIEVTVCIGAVKKTVEVALVALGPGFSSIGSVVTGVVIPGALTLVRTAAGVVTLLGGGAGHAVPIFESLP